MRPGRKRWPSGTGRRRSDESAILATNLQAGLVKEGFLKNRKWRDVGAVANNVR